MITLSERKERNLLDVLVAWIKLSRPLFFASPGIVPFSLGNILALHTIPSLNWLVAYGNLPLGVSWRCYIARSCGLSVERCQFKCMHYPRGIMAENLDGIPLFLINGPYIMSAKKRCLIRELEELETMGVTSIRIIPQYENTSEIVRIFRQAMDHQLSAQDAFEQLSYLVQSSLTNGWFHGEAGWKYIKGDHKFIEEGFKNLLSPLQNIC